MKTTFNNILAAVIKDLSNELKDFKTGLKNTDNLNTWYYDNLLTPTTKKAGYFNTTKEKKAYLLKRKESAINKRIQSETAELENIFKSDRKIKEINISVEWTKSAMWGSNPIAKIDVYFEGGGYSFYQSSAISGCGYDKESTAIAQALNQCPELLNALYAIKNKAKNKALKNEEIFGYGSGYGVKPSFSDGVGVSCYHSIFEKIGLKFSHISSGKAFDVWKVTRK